MLYVCETRLKHIGRTNSEEYKNANLVAMEMRKMNLRIVNKD